MAYFAADSPSFLAHVSGLVATGLVSVVVARWVYRKSDDRAGTVMVYVLAIHAVMATALLVQLMTPSLGTKTALALVWYAVVLTNPVAFFLFAVYYTGREHWLTPRVWALLGGTVFAVVGLLATNSVHELLISERAIRTEPFRHLRTTTTPLNGVVLGLSWLYLFAGFGLLVRMALFSRRGARWQLVAILAGLAAIVGSSVASVTEYAPIYNFPYGVYGAGVFGVVVAIALFRSRLFAVVALARDTIFESIDDAVVVVDADRRVVDFNRTARTVFPGIEERIGAPLEEAYPELLAEEADGEDENRVPVGVDDWHHEEGGDDRRPDEWSADTVAAVVERTDETPFAGVVRRSTGGETRTYSVSTSTISMGGRPRGYGLVVRDVSALVAYATDLERETERLDHFASVLSHDLRNHVTVAAGRIEVELEERDSDHLRTALAAVDRIETTVDDLLALARTGERIEDLEAVSLRTVATDAWETTDTREASLDLRVDVDYRLRADRSRLVTLLENLFRNAVDHGGDRVSVGTLDDCSGFYVADDGPGVPVDERDRVFEYGYSTADDGTGFGLAIVESIVEAHDWSIAVTDAEGGGVSDGRGEVGRGEAERDEDGCSEADVGPGARFEITGVAALPSTAD